MKTLALILLPLALSTTLTAQSTKYASYTETGLESSTTAQAGAHEPMTWLDNDACSDEVPQKSFQSSNEEAFNKKPKKKKNPNKGYSIAGEVSYTTGVGLYSGSMDAGFSAKHFFKGNTALEAILSASWRYRGARLTALYEVQKPIGTNGLYWYWGVGAHAGMFGEDYWNQGTCVEGRYQYNGKWYNCDGSRTTIGIDGTLGVEYQFTEAPFTISLGLKPSLDVMGRSNYYGDGAFAVRYVF